MATRKTITVTFNVTASQAIALEDMFAVWNQLSGLGASRWTSFYANGDGNFHPRILIDGHAPQRTNLIDGWKDKEGNKMEEYKMDFDSIAWKLNK